MDPGVVRTLWPDSELSLFMYSYGSFLFTPRFLLKIIRSKCTGYISYGNYTFKLTITVHCNDRVSSHVQLKTGQNWTAGPQNTGLRCLKFGHIKHNCDYYGTYIPHLRRCTHCIHCTKLKEAVQWCNIRTLK